MIVQEKLAEIRAQAYSAKQAATVQELTNAKVRFLGKKGELTSFCGAWGSCLRGRPVFGKLVNEVRDELEEAWAGREQGTLPP